MNDYYWYHVEYELRGVGAWAITPVSQTVNLVGPTLGINVIHRIGQGNYLRDINTFG